MIGTFFVAVAILATSMGPQAVAFPTLFATEQECNQWREEADKKLGPKVVILSKCHVMGSST